MEFITLLDRIRLYIYNSGTGKNQLKLKRAYRREMEQYTDMSQLQLQDYSLWEQDYSASLEMGMLSQGFSDSNAKDVSINIPDHGATTAKPKRRRLKGAAAAHSTTFLNASISNFRALVQHHTGCHNATKGQGPITLCFADPAPSPAPAPAHYYYSWFRL